jgi:hypothetical protein
MWRVGRRRLAWRPRSATRFLEGADGPIFLVVAVPVLGYWLLSWVGALLATVVVWPCRRVTGNWPVVAYQLDPPDGDDNVQRIRATGCAEAEAAARQWVLDIKQHGRPQPLVVASGSGIEGGRE